MARTKHIGDKTGVIKDRWMARSSSWEGGAWHRVGIGNSKGNQKRPEEKEKYMRIEEEGGKPVGWAV